MFKNYKKYCIIDNNKSSKNSALKFGLLFLSVGAGILVGGLLDSIFGTEPACGLACIFIIKNTSNFFHEKPLIKHFALFVSFLFAIFGGHSLIYYHHI